MKMDRPQKIALRPGFLDCVWAHPETEPLALPLRWLRESCSCALCLAQGHKKDLSQLAPIALDKLLSIRSIEAVGNYGMAVSWGDGHRSIYDFSRLKREYQAIRLPEHLASPSRDEIKGKERTA